MDFGSVGIEDVGAVVLQELWNKVAFLAMDLVSETKDVVLEKKSLQEFSSTIFELSTLLQMMDTQKVEAAMGSEAMKSALMLLHSHLTKAHKIIKDYKSGSRIRLLLSSQSILSQMKDLANEIATTLSSFQLVNLDVSLNLKTRADQIVNDLRSLQFQSAAGTELIASEIQSSIWESNMNRENARKLLEKIAEAVGIRASASLVQDELTLIKKEKEELEDQKKQAEALQLAQLIQLLYSTEIVTRPPYDDGVATYHQEYAITSFVCALCHEMMTDPVALVCGHSFERKAIQDHFNRGKKNCPTCGELLHCLDLTPNFNLRSSITEWKKRDMDLRFQAAVSGINSNEKSRQNKAFEDMQTLVEMSEYALKFSEQGLMPKLVDIMKENKVNRTATMKCLYLMAKHSEDQKEAMVGTGVIRHIVKQIYRGEHGADAIAVLMELSKRESLRESIGKTKDCIPLLVSLLQNDDADVKEKAWNTLENLCANTSFIIKMAEAGHFQPFVARFNQGPQESRASMAADLLRMTLKEASIKYLKNKQFIQNLVKMLSSNSPAYKLAGLKCIKKLIVWPKIVKQLLSDPGTVPNLLGIISFVRSDAHVKQEAGEILALLVGGCQHPEIQTNQGLLELQSEHNINLFLHLTTGSEPKSRIQFLNLLLQLSQKSEAVRDLIRSNRDAVSQLFSSLDENESEVKKLAMKFIICISDGHSDGVPLPDSHSKEAAINKLVTILTSSPDIEERSFAAGIISKLSKEDADVDAILQKSEALKAIREVICSGEEMLDKIRIPANVDIPLLENALAALLRFTEPTKPELQREVGKLELYPSLVRVLSRGSSLAKKRTATAIAHLSQSSSLSMSSTSNPIMSVPAAESSFPLLHVMNFFPNISWCCSTTPHGRSLCSVHGAACSARHTFCLVKADAVKPLVQILRETEPDVAEAALTALETLLADHSTMSHATAVIVESQGLVAILQVLEKGSLSAKAKALDLLHKIIKHTKISQPLFQRSERILIQLLHEDELKKKVALVLRQMKLIPEQSSYF
ncbi:hypothetical protein Tsubulata_006261 [Turnera subulata]|uniref:RING-type E3 ubiquitin transferase n=1 Tax=Turnera subulata TaxID=218843 RepID=A0A9Q0F8U4_9ROSI|nr:hypothetical protein Tsubulata_006261 [Turnera subulata]